MTVPADMRAWSNRELCDAATRIRRELKTRPLTTRMYDTKTGVLDRIERELRARGAGDVGKLRDTGRRAR